MLFGVYQYQHGPENTCHPILDNFREQIWEEMTRVMHDAGFGGTRTSRDVRAPTIAGHRMTGFWDLGIGIDRHGCYQAWGSPWTPETTGITDLIGDPAAVQNNTSSSWHVAWVAKMASPRPCDLCLC